MSIEPQTEKSDFPEAVEARFHLIGSGIASLAAAVFLNSRRQDCRAKHHYFRRPAEAGRQPGGRGLARYRLCRARRARAGGALRLHLRPVFIDPRARRLTLRHARNFRLQRSAENRLPRSPRAARKAARFAGIRLNRATPAQPDRTRAKPRKRARFDGHQRSFRQSVLLDRFLGHVGDHFRVPALA